MRVRTLENSPAVIRALLVYALVMGTGCRSAHVTTMPDVALPDVRGGTFQLPSQAAHPLLLAFAQTVPDTADTPSRRQVIFLSSMAEQYGSRGLRVAVVDASPRGTARDAVLNASYDWQLRFPLLLDEDGRVAHTIGVAEAPTTLLIAGDGRIVHEWHGPTGPAVLASSIEELLGPSHRQ